jgi:hypothetical protein
MADALLSKEITREELAAAYLTLFFKGKLTQSSLSTAIELSNITSPIKLPTNFDGLLNIITKKKHRSNIKNLVLWTLLEINYLFR